MDPSPEGREEAETKNPFVLFVGIQSKREKSIEMLEHSHHSVGKFSSRDDKHYQCFLGELMDIVKKANTPKAKGETSQIPTQRRRS